MVHSWHGDQIRIAKTGPPEVELPPVKMFLLIAAGLALFVLGVLAGAQFNRYEHTSWNHEPARFDRWTGKIELIAIDATEEWKTQAASSVSPDPWPGTPIPH